jgi:HAE1 family hydrophobic/amphiphilic exporter-1
MTFSLLCSLLVALYLDPMLSSINRDWVGGQGNVLWMMRAYREARERSTGGRLAACARVLPVGLRHARQWFGETTRTTFGPTWQALRGGNPHWTIKKVLRAVLHLITLPLVLVLYVVQLLLKVFTFLFGTLMFLLALLLLGLWVLARYILKYALWLPMQAFQVVYVSVHYVYAKILRFSLQFGPVVLLIVIALAVESYYLSKQLGRELIPPLRQGEFTIKMEARPGTRLEETEKLAKEIERVLLRNPDVGSLGLEVGMEKTNTKAERGENIAQFNIVLKDPEKNVGRQDEIIETLRRDIMAISSEQVTFVLPTLFSFKTAIELQILGDDLAELRLVGQRVLDAIRDIPGLKDPELSVKKGYPEIIIELDRDLLSTKGITPIQVAQRLRTEIQGDIATRFSQGGEKIDIRVRSDQERLKAVADLRTISVVDGNPPIPLASVARIRVEDGPSEIRRVDQRQVVMVQGNVEGFDLGTVTSEIEKRIRTVEKPSDYSYRFGGQNRELRTSFDNLQLALLLSIFLVYAVMAIQFESLIQPVLIMITLPLAFIGVINVLYFLNMPLSVAVFMGGILLVGVVVDNSILLVDYANQLRERGRTKREAIYESGQVRFRPVLMTAITTIVGTIPMAASGGEGAELRRPLAITIIAGLTLATVLTLVVIPVIYDVFGRRDKPGAKP